MIRKVVFRSILSGIILALSVLLVLLYVHEPVPPSASEPPRTMSNHPKGDSPGFAYPDSLDGRAAPGAPQPTGSSLEETLLAADRALRTWIGGMAWNPADSMQVGVPERIELLISPSHTGDSLAVIIAGDGGGRVLAREMRLTDMMRASLRGAGFEVDPQDAREQPVLPGEPTLWSWEVIPREVGDRRLTLRLEALMEYRNAERWRTLYDTVEVVRVWVTEPPAQPVRTAFRRFGEFAEKKPEFLFGTLLIPALLWVRRRWRKRRGEPKSEEKPRE